MGGIIDLLGGIPAAIGWLLVFMGYNTLSLPYYCILMGMIFIISDFLADYYVVKKNRQ